MNIVSVIVVFAWVVVTDQSTIVLQPMEEFKEPLQRVIDVFHAKWSKPGASAVEGQTGRSKRDVSTTGFTFPGTKWCGPGSTAENFHDLGQNKELDMCCRAHDHCEPELLSANNGLCQTRHLGFTM